MFMEFKYKEEDYSYAREKGVSISDAYYVRVRYNSAKKFLIGLGVTENIDEKAKEIVNRSILKRERNKKALKKDVENKDKKFQNTL